MLHLNKTKSVRDNGAVMRHARTRIIVSRDPITRRVGNVEVIYLFDFLRMLWNGELF